MTNWIFTTKIDVKEFENILKKKRWPIKATTRYRKFFKPKDIVIFYRGIPHGMKFVGFCVLKSGPIESESGDYLEFSKVEIWKNPILIQEISDDLDFIKKKDNWQIYLMGGVIRLPEKDYKSIIRFKN